MSTVADQMGSLLDRGATATVIGILALIGFAHALGLVSRLLRIVVVELYRQVNATWRELCHWREIFVPRRKLNGGNSDSSRRRNVKMASRRMRTASQLASLQRVLTADSGTRVMRHADAGYEEAISVAKERGVDLPMV